MPRARKRIQCRYHEWHCMDSLSVSTMRRVRVLAHIKKLDDCFGQFLVRVVCVCGACREIEPEARAPGRLEGDAQGTRATNSIRDFVCKGVRRGLCP
jgi:hypothetical protein